MADGHHLENRKIHDIPITVRQILTTFCMVMHDAQLTSGPKWIFKKFGTMLYLYYRFSQPRVNL